MNLSEILKQLGIHENYEIQAIPMAALPKQNGDGKITDSQGRSRSTLQYKLIKNWGRNNLIHQATRGGGSELVAVKRPRKPCMRLAQEGLIQAIAVQTLEAKGIRGAVPQVYEIFQFANEERICMEWIEGISLGDFLRRYVGQPAKFQTALLGSLTQLCILLDILERVMYLNHRDMKLDNIWIRSAATPISYTIRLGEKTFVWDAQFQVVLLDFGFACLGDASRVMNLNLGDVIPAMDACPKEGRDVYTIFCRILEIPEFSVAAGGLREKILGWMEPYQVRGAERNLLDTSEPGFKIPALSPQAFLAWVLSGSGGSGGSDGSSNKKT